MELDILEMYHIIDRAVQDFTTNVRFEDENLVRHNMQACYRQYTEWRDGHYFVQIFQYLTSPTTIHIQVKHLWNTLLEGRFYTKNTFFKLDPNLGALHEILEDNDLMNMWNDIEECIQVLCRKYTSEFSSILGLNPVMFKADVESSNVQEALEQCFEVYAVYVPDKESVFHQIVHTYEDVCVRIHFKETTEHHDRFHILIWFVNGPYRTHIYTAAYTFAKSRLMKLHGVEPDGFSSGFQKFMLLGSLLT